MRRLAFLLGYAVFLASGAARADDTMTSKSEPGAEEPRRRANATLFAAGLTSTIAGGVALNVGGAMLFVAGDPCLMGKDWCGTKNPDETLAIVGGSVMLAGVAMVAAGIPMAIAGGKRVPVSAAANGLVLTF